ncbi:MAG: lipopolysaccharide heptosyltransferase I [Acidobacteria bacterium]|nr:lipopolysaccharide heptosyltransferase I [Acidobacteriota bacterium]MCI0625068.1 lipopolysaccharide heptosyltransferase I [Acidobacteriota bacterium]MCI0718467.1 lipopolysaccharide heptosyltransferase I [Acidobacteriota bacterium]
MDTPRRVLIIKLGSIGDVVHTLPALTDLKRSFPEAEVDWLVESKSRVLLDGNLCLHEVIKIDTRKWRRSWSFATLREILQTISKLRARRYDAALDFQGLWKSAVLGRLSGARRLIGFDRGALKEPGCRIFYDERITPDRAARHVIDIYKELLRSLKVTPGPHRFDLPVPNEDEQYIAGQLSSRQIKDFFVLNPGGGWETKNWAPENYALLHDKLWKATGVPTVLTWGPGEEPLVEEVLRACAGPAPVTFPASLHQLIALLKRAKLFVGGDTGPLHLAAACGTPIVGIFGPTNPSRNGPFSSEDIVVSHQVPCGPCYKRTCEIYKKECMRLVQVEEIYKAILRRLQIQKQDVS